MSLHVSPFKGIAFVGVADAAQLNCIHAAHAWLFLRFTSEPMLEKLDRIKAKCGPVE